MAVTRNDKCRGLLLGAGLGDALGAPFEGRSRVGSATLTAEEEAPSNLVHTDDTALTLALAEHLAARRAANPLDDAIDEDTLAQRFAEAWRREPWRGFGGGIIEVFGLIHEGVPWHRASRAIFGGEGSFGNGAAMRVAPVALVGRSLQHTVELGYRSAVVSHAHPDAQHGAALQAAAAFLALCSDPATPLDSTLFLQGLGQVVHAPAWQDKLDRIAELLTRRSTPQHAGAILGNGVAALESVPTAVLAFLRNPDDSAETIRYAIHIGGDTDTIASMAGALAGARNGAKALPTRWIRRLEPTARLVELADRLS
ncbi:hypothetical protein GCM10012275_18850 [Longimycelium tulufanense]|uniref:ADP-ribosylglycohydrolase n=1 Tax=Longimycelium tulufanense TaxID=907463 RepID=A0A8J3CCN9_9PSEU|nr:ADP-ribosylglycohydrolase family protein [Longimycelium tulufanense]GGM48025.1 hypothetical protein GCM10012275_18850 [Longimycelium tulufanense]